MALSLRVSIGFLLKWGKKSFTDSKVADYKGMHVFDSYHPRPGSEEKTAIQWAQSALSRRVTSDEDTKATLAENILHLQLFFPFFFSLSLFSSLEKKDVGPRQKDQEAKRADKVEEEAKGI